MGAILTYFHAYIEMIFETHYAKHIINEESTALKKLSASLNVKFTMKSIKILSNTKGNVIITGVGKSGFAAKKYSLYYDTSICALPNYSFTQQKPAHGDPRIN